MYCKYCGKEVDNDAVICPACGKLTDVGNQVVKAVGTESTVATTQQKAQKGKLAQGTITAFVALIVYVLGKILHAIFYTSININMIAGGVQMSEIVLVIISGIFSIICLGVGITSTALIFSEKTAKIRRIFPLCMMIISVAYFIEFICEAVLTSALTL